jgi:hypothetical protein
MLVALPLLTKLSEAPGVIILKAAARIDKKLPAKEVCNGSLRSISPGRGGRVYRYLGVDWRTRPKPLPLLLGKATSMGYHYPCLLLFIRVVKVHLIIHEKQQNKKHT